MNWIVPMKRTLKLAAIAVVSTSLLASLSYKAFAASHNVQDEVSRRTEANILEKWQLYLPQRFTAEQLFKVKPAYSSPHRAGQLNDNVLQDALNATNFARYLAGLPDDVILDYSIAEQQQAGAVLMSEIGTLNHHPSQPAGMAEDFYKFGYAAASSSNLSAGGNSLYDTVFFGYMADNSASNLYSVGHRRWIINPQMKKTMFGLAYNNSSSYGYYSTMHAFNRDRDASEVDYQYIAWPSAGLFPTDVLTANDPWSISLNPDIYDRERTNEIYVTMSRESDDRTWTLREQNQDTNGNFFLVDTTEYGIGYAVIFRPEKIGEYAANDTYRVTIHNLYTTSGEKTSISYNTTLFDLQATYRNNSTRYALVGQELKFPTSGKATRYVSSNSSIASVDKNGIVTAHKPGPVTIIVDSFLTDFQSDIQLIVTNDDDYKSSKWVNSSMIKANEYGILASNPYFYDVTAPVTREEFVGYVIGLLEALNPKIDYGDYHQKPSAFSDVHQSQYEITWAYEQGIISGTGGGKFSPNAIITREQAAVLLLNVYNYLEGKEHPVAVLPFADQDKIASWAKQAVKRAAELSIMGSESLNHFNPQGDYSHEQTIVTLLRLYTKFSK